MKFCLNLYLNLISELVITERSLCIFWKHFINGIALFRVIQLNIYNKDISENNYWPQINIVT